MGHSGSSLKQRLLRDVDSRIGLCPVCPVCCRLFDSFHARCGKPPSLEEQKDFLKPEHRLVNDPDGHHVFLYQADHPVQKQVDFLRREMWTIRQAHLAMEDKINANAQLRECFMQIDYTAPPFTLAWCLREYRACISRLPDSIGG